MKICVLCAVIIVSLTNDARADEQKDQNILSTEAMAKSSNLPRLLSYGEITADDQPDHHPENQSRIRFEDQSLERPVKFKDDPKEHGYIDIDKAKPGSLLADIKFDDDESFDQNDRISNTRSGYEGESNNSQNKIKFEGNTDEQYNSDDQEDNDEEDDSQTGASQVVFEDDGKGEQNGSDNSDESEIEAEGTDKPFKFEYQDDESKTNNRDSGRSPPARVVFKDYSHQNQQPVQKEKRKPRRKPHYEPQQSNPAPIPPNSPYPGLGYPGNPGVGYSGPGFAGPGDPNTGYSGYPTPGYPAPGYPYPNYPNPYPSMAFPTPAYPGYLPYPSIYPPMSPGYGAYPTLGYQVPGDPRPPTSPTAYPIPGQGAPSGHSDTKFPSQEYPGSPAAPGAPPSSTPLSGQPGPTYLGSEYPYYQGYPVPGYPPPYPSDANSQYPPQNQAQYRPPVYPGVHQQGYQPQGPQRPSRRPKSLTQRAVSAVAEALTSIALYDDQQCVPRILCEVAGGSTSSPTLLKASASLQPLLSLLQAYNGVSTSPLFIFGQAAVTGMTAKGNPSACHRAYPLCPSDPEKLINYLNNHNGGFFRFFGQPDIPQQQHNLEQFYNYLSGQNGLPQQPQQQNYGHPRPYGYGFPLPNPYAHPYNYGHNNYNEQIGYRNAKNIDIEVEGRIQNKPGVNVLEAESDSSSSESSNKGSNWSFPEEGSTKKGNERDKVKIKKRPKRPPQAERQERPPRGSKTLKFPDNRSDGRREIQMLRDNPRKEKKILFPGETHYQINTNYQTTTPVNPEEYYFDHKHNFYVKRPKALKTDDVVYVVRGNGDPNHPEIVRVRPGQSI